MQYCLSLYVSTHALHLHLAKFRNSSSFIAVVKFLYLRPLIDVYQVRWDEDIGNDHQERVSLWEIDPSVSLPPLSIQSSPRLKKLRTSLQAFPPNPSIPGRLLESESNLIFSLLFFFFQIGGL